MKRVHQWLQQATPAGLLILGVVVGMGGAIGAALFHILIYISTLIFFGHDGSTSFIGLVEALPVWQRLFIPTLGGLLVGITYALTKVSEAEGEGVPEVIEALAIKRGTIRPVVAPVKILTAAITLGSGGSAGREGPVIQIGSAIGSSIAQFTKQAAPERSLLLAAGAAAAIGGTFGAPIAGILFTIEILHHRSYGWVRAFVLVIAAGIGAFATRLLTGHEGLRFMAEATVAWSSTQIIALIILALLAAVTAFLFGRILNFTRDGFKKLPIPHMLKPAVGGFLVGVVGITIPYIHEPAAYPLMVDLIGITTLPIIFLLLLFFAKMIITGVTLGSGGSGGLFAPLLLIGAIVGSVVSSSTLLLFPDVTLSVPLMAVVGMATVFAAAAHAPLTAAVITYEMTGEIMLLPPLIATSYIAVLVAKRINPQSVYRIHEDETH